MSPRRRCLFYRCRLNGLPVPLSFNQLIAKYQYVLVIKETREQGCCFARRRVSRETGLLPLVFGGVVGQAKSWRELPLRIPQSALPTAPAIPQSALPTAPFRKGAYARGPMPERVGSRFKKALSFLQHPDSDFFLGYLPITRCSPGLAGIQSDF